MRESEVRLRDWGRCIIYDGSMYSVFHKRVLSKRVKVIVQQYIIHFNCCSYIQPWHLPFELIMGRDSDVRLHTESLLKCWIEIIFYNDPTHDLPITVQRPNFNATKGPRYREVPLYSFILVLKSDKSTLYLNLIPCDLCKVRYN